VKSQKQETQRKIAMDSSAFLPKIPVWVYRLLAIFPMTGMIGMDHFAIGSKETGMAKGLVNLLTFGSWYFFDIAQSLDATKVVEEGLAIPFYGQVGIGQGNFGEGLLGSKDPSVKFWLNIMFIFVGLSLAGIAGIFTTRPNPIGTTAKVVAGTAGAITLSLIGMTVYSSVGNLAPVNLSGIVSGLVLQGGGAEPTRASITELITLGTLTAITLAGFVLHSARSST
jgi:hypothetical protein